MKVRIAKFMASCGLGSRRKCEELIVAGNVKVNGELINSPALSIDPDLDKVEMKGKIIEPEHKVYYLLNKPAGYTSTLADVHAKRLIGELVPLIPSVWPVGRLDRETSGLIILTNDGELTQQLTHPSFEKQKAYIASLNKPLTEKQFLELKQGINLEDGIIRPDELTKIGEKKYEVIVHEGRNRLVRRIFEYFDTKVITLTRTKLAFLTIEGLACGSYRELTADEITRLMNA